jgi:hypothetical protein
MPRKEVVILTIKEGHDPKNGVVAIFYGNIAENEKPGFWVEAHRTNFESDYVSETEAQLLFEQHINNSQAFA